MHAPLRTFLFLLSCLILLTLISFIIPNKGLILSENIRLKFYNVENLFLNIDNKKDSVDNIIKEANIIESEADSAVASQFTVDTLKIKQQLRPLKFDSRFQSLIEYPNNNRALFYSFFQKLQGAGNKSMHILYYGDSQIEEDRFSGYIREHLQSAYGGSGSGLCFVMPVAQWSYPKISYSENWLKWSCFNLPPKKTEICGPLAQSFLYEGGAASFTINCNGDNAPAHQCAFNKIKLFYGYANESVKIKYFNNNELLLSDSIYSTAIITFKEYPVKYNTSVAFEFSGKSPLIYGVSLENYNKGVYVDNIALRGSSGTFFNFIQPEMLTQFFNELNVGLIVLQFGGNAMPMIDSDGKAIQYGNFIDYQIKILRNINPHIPILFVGPADMSVNENGEMITHPYLEKTIDAIRKAVLNNQCAFFDMYKAMGGRNSMPVWVNEGIAAKDYIHFSPVGARKMATFIYYSLMKDFYNLQEHKNTP